MFAGRATEFHSYRGGNRRVEQFWNSERQTSSGAVDAETSAHSEIQAEDDDEAGEEEVARDLAKSRGA